MDRMLWGPIDLVGPSLRGLCLKSLWIDRELDKARDSRVCRAAGFDAKIWSAFEVAYYVFGSCNVTW